MVSTIPAPVEGMALGVADGSEGRTARKGAPRAPVAQ